MHYFILLMLVFMAPTSTKPESLHTQAFTMPSMSDCETIGEMSSIKIEQSKDVSAVRYNCIEVTNPLDNQA